MKKLRPIARKRRSFIYLLFAILFLIFLGYAFVKFSPDHKFNFFGLDIPLLPFFLFSVFAFIYSLLTFLFIQKTQGIIVGGILFSYLSLRLIGLTHWIFLVLFFSLLFTIELFLIKKK